MGDELNMNDQSMMSMDQSFIVELTESMSEQKKYTEDELEEYRSKYRRFMTAKAFGVSFNDIRKDIQKAGRDFNKFEQLCNL